MRNLIIKEIKEELDYLLNTIYKDTILPETSQIKILYSDYDPSKAKDLSLLQLRYITGNTIYKKTEEDLFEHLMYTLDNGKAVTTKQLLVLLPIYKALINSNNIKLSMGALRSYMDIHCASDIREYTSSEKNGQGIFSILDGLDHILGTKDSFFDINSAALFINYFNNKKDSLLVPEYKEELLGYYNKLYPFLEFYTSPEFISKFNNGEEDITNISVCKDNEDLIKFFLNCDIPKFRNQYYKYKYLNDLIKLASDDKNAVMTRFAYDELSIEDFNSLGRTDITFEDIEDFITSYELAGNRLNSRQLERLLINYRKNYLNNNYLLSTYNKEVELVRKAYDEYSSKIFAYTNSDFIEYFNSKYNYEFECFSFDGTKSLLNVDILDEIIDNRSSLIERLDSVSVSEYLDYNCVFIDEDTLKEAKESIYDKYYGVLTNYLSKKDVTLEYFIRENVSHKDEELFRELLKWYCKHNNCDTKVDISIKERTAELILTEALQELEVNSLDAREVIIEKYKSYLAADKLEDFCSCTRLGKAFAQAAKERLAIIEEDIVNDAKLAIKNDTNFYDIATKYEVLPRDIETIVNKHFKDKRIKEKLKIEKHQLAIAERDETLAKKKAQTRAKWHRIMDELLSSNERIEDFCKRYNSENNDEVISASRILDVIRHTDYFDEEYNQYCMDRIIGDKIGHQSIENKESVMFGIYNGVESCNGRRDYTLFDLFMEEGEPIRLDDVKYELLENNPYLGEDYPVKTKAFIRTSIERFGLFFPDNTQERVYDLDEARKLKLIWPVGNTKHLVTEEEKDVAIEFIKATGFPKQMYFDALAAHIRGEYDLVEMISAKQLQKTNKEGQ